MPLEQIRSVLDATEPAERDAAIISHLQHMEGVLEQTQATIASLRELLEGRTSSLEVEFRTIPATRALAIREVAEWDTAETWLVAAITDLYDVLGTHAGARRGPDGALFHPEFFEAHTGELIAYIPVAEDIPLRGRAELIDLPAVDVAVTLHKGPFADLDKAYGALGTFVAERAIGIDGPIREHYLVAVADDPADLRTEVAWPVRHRA
jgi:effector-binding domain-containing protein